MNPTETHKLYRQALRDHDMKPVIAYGSAGTGKTFGAIEAAVEWLQKTNNRRVVITRPPVSFAEEQGFLPGTEREKMEPWLRPIIQNFELNGFTKSHVENCEKNGRIVFLPLGSIQGLTWDNTMIIVDECQNMTFSQMRVLLTREGKWSKTILCGDVAQVSPMFGNSGLADLIKMVHALDLPVHTIEFTADDILRSARCKQWIVGFEKWDRICADHEAQKAAYAAENRGSDQ